MSPWIITDREDGATVDDLDYSEMDEGWVADMAIHGDYGAMEYLESLNDGE